VTADRSRRPFGTDPSTLQEVLAVICDITSKLSSLREKWKLINVTAVREQKVQSHKDPDTNQLDFYIHWISHNKGEQTERCI